MKRISLSLVVPVYSGASYLPDLLNEIEFVRNDWLERALPFSIEEVIFVEDAAIDASAEALKVISAHRPWVTVLHLARNFGQHAATIAGILHCSGDWIVTLDEDLQHPPSEILALLCKATEDSSDIVYASGIEPTHESLYRDFMSRTYKHCIGWLTGNTNVSRMSSFRLIRGSIARAASSVCTHDTYFDISLSWFTQRVSAVSMHLKDKRFIETGKSGYSLRRLLSHARRMLVSSQIKPLRIGTFLGGGIVLSCILAIIVLVGVKLANPNAFAVRGWTSLMLAIIFFGGVCITLLGIALEYLALVVLRAHGKPLFFVVDRSTDAVLAGYFAREKT